MDEQTFRVIQKHAQEIKALDVIAVAQAALIGRLTNRLHDIETVLRDSAPHIEDIEHRRDVWNAEYGAAIAEGETKRQPE